MPDKKDELVFEDSIEIKAPPEKVWEVLTEPEYTKQYMFGCNAESDWRVGSPLLWRGAQDGKVYVEGKIVAIEPAKKLSFTTVTPGSASGSASTVTEELVRSNGGTLLRITDGDFSKLPDGDKRYEKTTEGWKATLPLLKKTAEAHGEVGKR